MARPSPAVAARTRLHKRYLKEGVAEEERATRQDWLGFTEGAEFRRGRANRAFRRAAVADLMSQGWRPARPKKP